MSSLKIEFETDNAAFDGRVEEEIAIILKQLARRVVNTDLNDIPEGIRDFNGNTIGTISYQSD